MNHSLESKQPEDFFLVLGGPLFQFFIRARHTTDADRPRSLRPSQNKRRKAMYDLIFPDE